MKKSKLKFKNRDKLFMSATGSLFILTKNVQRWYVLGRAKGAKVPYALAFGPNKHKLMKYVKQELGFKEVSK